MIGVVVVIIIVTLLSIHLCDNSKKILLWDQISNYDNI